MKRRNIFVMILLIIFTLGIYGIVWTCKFQSELKEQTGEGFGAFGHLMMLIFTFGIYQIYWQFAAGKRLAKLGTESNLSVMYLLFCFVGLSFLNPFIMQHQANKIATN